MPRLFCPVELFSAHGKRCSGLRFSNSEYYLLLHPGRFLLMYYPGYLRDERLFVVVAVREGEALGAGTYKSA